MRSFFQKTQQTLVQFLSRHSGGQQQQQQPLQPPGQMQPQPHQHHRPAGAKAPHALTWHAGGSGAGSVAAVAVGGSSSAAASRAEKSVQPPLLPDMAPLPGLALYYTEALQGVPHTLSKLVRNRGND